MRLKPVLRPSRHLRIAGSADKFERGLETLGRHTTSHDDQTRARATHLPTQGLDQAGLAPPGLPSDIAGLVVLVGQVEIHRVHDHYITRAVGAAVNRWG